MPDMNYINSIFFIYRQLTSERKRGFWCITGLSIFVALAELGVAGFISLFGVAVANPNAIVEHFKAIESFAERISWLDLLHYDQRGLLVVLLAGAVVAIMIKDVASALLAWSQALYSQRVSYEIGSRLFRGYLYGSYLWHVGQELSKLHTHLTWRTYISAYLLQFLSILAYIITALCLLTAVFVAAPIAALIVFILTGGCAYVTFRFARRRVAALSKQQRDIALELSRITLPALQGVREIQIYSQQEAFLKSFDELAEVDAHRAAKQNILQPLPPWVLELVGVGALLLVVIYMNLTSAPIGRMTGALALLAATAWRLMPIMNKFVGSLLALQTATPYVSAVLQRLAEVAHFESNCSIVPDPCALNEELLLENVSFRYPGATKDALSEIKIVIPRGSMLGIVGSSGAGKSTLVGLLTGLFEPTLGHISLDGKPLKDARRFGWLRNIGYVPQSPFLLNATIAQNIAFSQWGKPIDMERVNQCSKMAAMDFVDDLHEGLNTIIGERGIRLSGGQIQRISIARALFEDPQLVLFDEATSALDGASESAIQQTINKLRHKMTLVVVAHRLSTVTGCDYLYWLDDGKIRMEGQPNVVLSSYRTFLKQKADLMASVS